MDPQDLAEVLVELTDSLVSDFDGSELLQRLVDRCVELLSVDAAGLLVVSGSQQLELAATSRETAAVLKLLALQTNEGPSRQVVDSGEAVVLDLASDASAWPQLTAAAQEDSITGLIALPLRVRTETLGVLNLFVNSHGLPHDPLVIPVGQAMADVSSIALVHQRRFREAHALNAQLQQALDSRLIIEQAKGVLAAGLGIGTGEAFERLRRHARAQRRLLREVAAEVVADRDVTPFSTAAPPSDSE